MTSATARACARLKTTIAAAGIHPANYARANTTLLQELTDRAQAERKLPSVPVWEKPDMTSR